jgi:sugar lactone lactonase YvrE
MANGRNRNRFGSNPGRTSLKPVLLAAAAGYFLQKNLQATLLPWGPAIAQVPPRVPSTGNWHAPVDPTNDSLRFRHGRTYKIFAKDGTSIRGAETILVHPIDQSVYVMTENAALIQLSNLPNAQQERELLEAKNYNYYADTIVVQADLGPGRPLGGSFTPDGKTLYIADSALGLTRLQDYTNPHSRVEVVASQVPVLNENGEQYMSPILYANSVAIGPKTGNVYFTDATDIPPIRTLQQVGEESSRWDILYPSKMDLARGKPAGRLLEYNPTTGQVRVLQHAIQFANGVGIDTDEQFLVVSETFGTNMLKFNLNADDGLLKPSQYLQPQVLIPNHELVGYMDNVSCGVNDSLQTICYCAIWADFAGPHKLIRRLPNQFLQVLVRTLLLVAPRSWVPTVVPTFTGVVIVDPSQPYQEGQKNYSVLQDPSGEDLVSLTGATVSPDHSKLYLGSLVNDYVGVYLLKEAEGKAS